jgi:hypothetical protein
MKVWLRVTWTHSASYRRSILKLPASAVLFFLRTRSIIVFRSQSMKYLRQSVASLLALPVVLMEFVLSTYWS